MNGDRWGYGRSEAQGEEIISRTSLKQVGCRGTRNRLTIVMDHRSGEVLVQGWNISTS